MNGLPRWVELFQGLRSVDDRAWFEAASEARLVTYPASTVVFGAGDACQCFMLVQNGAIRVNKILETGREIVLYRLHAGDCCSITTSVLMAGNRYSANAVTEVETRVLLIPKQEFERAFALSAGFRQYVCTELGVRFHDALMMVESLAMRNVEARLARWLIQHGSDSGTITTSHRELASELGTAREVISRHLKNFEKQGLVKLSRKYIELADMSALDKCICS